MNQVATQEKNEVAVKKSAPRGIDMEIDKEDLKIPRVKLLQKMSPEMDMDAEEYKTTYGYTPQAGLLINSLTRDVLPDEFLPVKLFYQWVKFTDDGKIEFVINDPHDPRLDSDEAKFGENGEPPVIIKSINALSYFPGYATPLVISFAKTSLKFGRDLLTMIKFTGKDSFATKFKLVPTQQETDGKKYYVLKVAMAGGATDEDFKNAEALYNSFSDKKIEVDHGEQTADGEDCPI